MTHRSAFSLIELSIAIVIIGLIVGGVMAGASLIRVSEVKTVISEFATYKQAALDFRMKYSALPGDLPDATSYWPSAANGDGNGQILSAGAGAGAVAEFAQFWSQLVSAGLIEGAYTGTAGTVGGGHAIVGTNVPKATLTKAGWNAFWVGVWGGNANNFSYDYGNLFGVGGNTGLDTWAYSGVLKPEEVWNIDLKIDDGMPGAGKMIVTNIVTCSTATSNTDYAATYRLDSSTMDCGIYLTKFDE